MRDSAETFNPPFFMKAIQYGKVKKGRPRGVMRPSHLFIQPASVDISSQNFSYSYNNDDNKIWKVRI